MLKNIFENAPNNNEDETPDSDACSSEELRSIFSKTCSQVTSRRIFPDKDYILHLDVTSDNDPSVVIASNTSIDILKLSQSQLTKAGSIDLLLDNECIGVKFAPLNSNMLYVACSKANIKMYDLRAGKEPISTFVDSTVNNSGDMKTFLSFDVSPDDKLVTAGTELYDGDSFILFWDARNANLLGAYWESHTDDITQVKFHADDRNKLLSGSTDGLINMYNLREETEDDALTECLNTESSVEQIAWCGGNVFCATHTHNVQMWRLEDATPYGDFKRERLLKEIKRKSDDYNYIAGCFTENKQPVLLIGSNFKDGECLRALRVSNVKPTRKEQLKPLFDCIGNSQRVRCLHFNERTSILITGGEKGIVDVWKLGNLS